LNLHAGAMSQHAELLACMISSWYPQFKHVTFKTSILSLPQEFVDYLVADGVYLPADSEAVSCPSIKQQLLATLRARLTLGVAAAAWYSGGRPVWHGRRVV
jgi:hypothetical protein